MISCSDHTHTPINEKSIKIKITKCELKKIPKIPITPKTPFPIPFFLELELELSTIPLLSFPLTKTPSSLTLKSTPTTKRCRLLFHNVPLYLIAVAISTLKATLEVVVVAVEVIFPKRCVALERP